MPRDGLIIAFKTRNIRNHLILLFLEGAITKDIDKIDSIISAGIPPESD